MKTVKERDEKISSLGLRADRVGTGRAQGRDGKKEGRKEGRIDTGQSDSQGEESGISRLAGVAMVTELGRDVIMPRLIQT